MTRVKQFDDLVEENPDFIVLRNHIAKSVTGEGKKIALMGSLWRLIRHACQISQRMPYEPTPHVPAPSAEPVKSAQIGPDREAMYGQESASVPGEST